MSVDLRVKIAGIEFKNPIFVAAGGQTRNAETILKSGEHGVAAVMTKTIVPQTANDVLPCFVPVEAGLLTVFSAVPFLQMTGLPGSFP